MLVLSLCRITVSVKYSKKENQRYHVTVYCEHLRNGRGNNSSVFYDCLALCWTVDRYHGFFFGAELCEVNGMVVSTFWV